MNLNKDYYNVLGVTKNSSEDEIKKAFRKKAQETHPDKHKGDDTKFKEINEANQILGDKQKKKSYDIKSPHGKNPQQGFGGGFGDFNPFNTDPFSAFSSFFNMKFTQEREEFIEDLDININIDVNLKSIYENKPITAKYKRRVKCDNCKGTGFDRNSHSEVCEVCNGKGRDVYGFVCEQCLGEGKIYTGTCKVCNGEKVVTKEQEIKLEKPAIIRSSTRNFNRNFAHHSKYYREKVGTLIVNINFLPDDNIEIDGYDLHLTKNIHFQDAIDGKEFIYTHVDDSKIKITIPAKTKDCNTITLKGKGLLKNDNTRGNFFIKMNVIIDYDKLKN